MLNKLQFMANDHPHISTNAQATKHQANSYATILDPHKLTNILTILYSSTPLETYTDTSNYYSRYTHAPLTYIMNAV